MSVCWWGDVCPRTLSRRFFSGQIPELSSLIGGHDRKWPGVWSTPLDSGIICTGCYLDLPPGVIAYLVLQICCMQNGVKSAAKSTPSTYAPIAEKLTSVCTVYLRGRFYCMFFFFFFQLFFLNFIIQGTKQEQTILHWIFTMYFNWRIARRNIIKKSMYICITHTTKLYFSNWNTVNETILIFILFYKIYHSRLYFYRWCHDRFSPKRHT